MFAVSGHQWMTEHSTTNNKQVAVMDDDNGMEGRRERRGAWEGMLIHRVDGDRVGSSKN
jgi:hypothetical protein